MSKVYVFLGDMTPDRTLATNKRDAYCPDGGYFDKSAKQYFHSKTDKRQWLARHGMREAGIVNPDKAPD